MVCYMVICKAPLTEGYSEALCLSTIFNCPPELMRNCATCSWLVEWLMF